jgi:hypothetical protein
MRSRHTFIILLIINSLLILALFGAAYGIDQLLTTQSKTLAAQRLQTQTLDAQSSALVKAKKDVKQYQDLANIASSIVPQDKDQAQTVREIVNIAAANGVKLGTISFPTSTLGQAANGLPTTSQSVGSQARSQLTPVKGIPGVYSLEIVVQSDTNNPVPYGKFTSFLTALEHNRRTALVSNLNLNPDSKNSSNVGFSLTLDEYIKP